VMTMVRLLWLLLIAFLVYKLIQSLRHLSGRRAAKADHRGGQGEELVRDPHCGAYFPQSEGVSAVIDGEKHHFCGPECRDKFLHKK